MTFVKAAPASGGVPLVSVPTVVLDTETTGLDPAGDRIVQIGAVRIAAGKIDGEDVFDRLVNPAIPIPPASTEIHNISDADVSTAEDFPTAMPALAEWVGTSLVVGYSIGFDLAVLKSEHQRHGLAWHRPRSLDVRDLIEIVAPDLPEASLELAADWLGIEVRDRHQALGDARLTAEIYLALISKLSAAGITTLAQAERASLTRGARQHEAARSAGWEEVVEEALLVPATVNDYARIDSFPYRHRVRDIMHAPPRLASATTTLADALAMMMREQISSVFVQPSAGTDDYAILTERDILRAIDAEKSAALSALATDCATRPLRTIAEDEFIYRAIVDMSARRIRHLGVHDEAGALVGALSARDLLKQRASDAISLGDSIAKAQSVAELGKVWSELTVVTRGLVYEEVDSRDIAAVVSRELRALTKRACEIAERELVTAGDGGPPVPYAMLVLGSGGRGESLLAMDQDNAIVYASGEAADATDRWFEKLGSRVADILNEVGVTYCQGGVMAKNAAWRMSLERWHQVVEAWITRSRAEDILNADIFFDCRVVHGEARLAETLLSESLTRAAAAANFQHTLATNAARFESMLGLFGRFRLTNGRIDLKKGGLFPIVSTARVLALRHALPARATPARLEGVATLMPEQTHVATALIEAHRILLDLVLRQQLRDLDRGMALSNAVRPSELTKHEQQELRWALEQIPGVPNLLGTPLFASA